MLDFGCGSKPYKSLINADQYVGMDYQGQGHSHENEQIDVFYDGKMIPLESNSFDSVLSTEVFEHVFNLEEMLAELHRVMKPGAVMLISCPFIIAEHEAPNDCSRYTSYGLQKLLARKGFEIVHYQKIGTSVQTRMQMLMSYLDLLVLSPSYSSSTSRCRRLNFTVQHSIVSEDSIGNAPVGSHQACQ